MKKNLLIGGAVLIYVMAYFTSGCEHDDQLVEISKITAVTAEPNSISQGGTLTLVVSTKDEGDFTFFWNAVAGTFDDPQNDTTSWKAPDEPGPYVISVIVSDASGSSVATVNVGVDTYVPSETPSYLGITNCASCHEGITHTWEETGHAEALSTLASIGRDETASCLGCHTVGHDTEIANGGYDEIPVARLANVQCENCHGPGSDHNGDPAGTSVSFDAITCGQCHQGEHHPYMEEWEESAHAESLTSAGGFVTQNDGCVKCHVSEAFVEFVKTGTTPPASSLTTMNPINCQSCHDPHVANGGNHLRTSSVDLVCGECHTSGTIDNVNRPGEPHHPQWNMLHGTDGLEYAGVEYDDSPHVFVVEGKCASCHVSMVPFSGEIAKTGHTFEPKLRSCTTCHTSASDFDVNGVQTSIVALLDDLEDELASASAADSATRSFRQAVYNFEYVEADGSHGVHNYKYARDLLESSIDDFEPN